MEMWNSQISKKGEGYLFQEFLQAINQPLLESEVQQSFFNAPVTFDQDKFAGQNAGHGGKEKAASSSAHVQKVTTVQDGVQNAGQDAINIVESALTMCSPPPFVLDAYRGHGGKEKAASSSAHVQKVTTVQDGVQNVGQDAINIVESALTMCSPPPFVLDAYRGHGGKEKAASSSAHVQKVTTVQDGVQNAGQDAIKIVESALTMCSPPPFVLDAYRGHGGKEKAASSSAHVQKVMTVQDGVQNAGQDAIKIVESALTMCSPPPFVLDAYRETDGPIFDVPLFTSDTWSSSSLASANCSRNLSLAHGIKDTKHRIRQKRKVKVPSVPSRKNANRMTAERKENKRFDQIDEELNWTEKMTGYDKVPKWPQAGSGEINASAAHLSNKVLGKNSPSGNINFGSRETIPDLSLRAERRSDPLKRLSRGMKDLSYRDENDKNGNPFEIDNFNHIVVGPCRNENQLEGGGSICYRGNEDHQPLKRARNYMTSQEVGCSDPLLATQRSVRMASPSILSQKCSSPSAANARSNSALEGPAYELAGGEIADPGADPLLPVSPNPGCLNSTSADAEDIAIDAAEPYRGSRGIISQYTRRPITSETKMSAFIQRKCKSVICELQRRIIEEGDETVPLFSYACKSNIPGIHLMDFEKIYQLLDGANYNRIIDFLGDIQSMFEATAQQFGFSREMRSEVVKVQEMFFDIMKAMFPDINYP